jgi:hypothetical protein
LLIADKDAMASYRSTDREDRAKAIAGVLLVHVALGAVILTGLNVSMVRRAVEQSTRSGSSPCLVMALPITGASAWPLVLRGRS